jgi:hypothetical protein
MESFIMAQATVSKIAQAAKQATIREQSPDQSAGYHAQGFALASSFFGVIKAHQMDLGRFVRDAWPLSVEARAYALKTLGEFVKQARENAKLSQPAAGIDPKAWGRIARTASTRVSQFGAILRAMNAGMNHQTLCEFYKIEDPEHLTFDSVLEVARGLNASSGSNAGRKPDAFLMRLAKWMNRNTDELSDDDRKAYNKVMKLIGDMLPEVDTKDKKGTAAASGVTQKAAKKVARKTVKAAAKAAPTQTEEKRVEEQPLPKGVKEERRAEPHQYH